MAHGGSEAMQRSFLLLRLRGDHQRTAQCHLLEVDVHGGTCKRFFSGGQLMNLLRNCLYSSVFILRYSTTLATIRRLTLEM